jgi:hypothetical protein
MFTTQKQVVIMPRPSRQKSASTCETGNPKDGACLLHLTHVVHALAVRGEPEPEPEQARPRLDLMAAELVQIGKVLDQAKRAESLQFIAPGFGREWDRLGRRVEQIQHDIHMQTRRGDE